MPKCAELVLQPGEILYKEGDPNDCGYVIESGEVILYSQQSGQKVFIERRGAGAIIGELSILTGQPRTVTVEATSPSRIFKLPAQQIVERYQRLDPVLQACVETSISFAAALKKSTIADICAVEDVPLAEKTLRRSEDVIERLRIEAGLSDALAQKEFHMLFQPIVRMDDGSIVGAEALVRWNSPMMGMVSPADFIPVAEETGMIGDLTEFALSVSCALLGKLRRSGLGDQFFLSVNASGKDVSNGHLVEFIDFTMDRYEVPASSLKIEVTETALINDLNMALSNLQRLRDLGCGVSLDDFGSGYSNFANLTTFPFTTMKIDSGFIEKLRHSESSEKIVQALVELGRSLKLEVIAEGLEEAQEYETLKRLGCPLAQGYYFHKPGTAEILIKLLAEQQDCRRNTG